MVRAAAAFVVFVLALVAQGLATSAASPGDLKLTKLADLALVSSGQPLVYTLLVENLGATDATNVTVSDPLPAGTSFTSATAGCAHSAGVVTCGVASLAALSTRGFQITVQAPVVSGLPLASITNTATVSAAEADPDTTNNTASVSTYVQPRTDLSLTKTGPATAAPGSTIAFTITVTNNGPSDATRVLVYDPLPAGTTAVSFTSPQSVICDQEIQGVPHAGEYGCRFATLASGASATMTFTVIVEPWAGSLGTISNTATAYAGLNPTFSNDVDPNTANNSATATVTVASAADLSITKSPPDGTVVSVGARFTYALTVGNAGPSTATNVVVTDTLPAGVTLVSMPSFCGQSGSTVTCTFTSLPPSLTTTTIALEVSAPSTPATLTNTATVAATETDPNTANNSATVTTTVIVPSADVSLSLSAPATLDQGTVFAYTITAHNGGPQTATNVVVSDTLAASLTFGSATWQIGATTGSCANSSGTVTCTAAALGSGQDMVVTLNVTPTAAGTVSNSASVSASETDPDLSNNSAALSRYVRAPVDLALQKIDVGGLHLEGGSVLYSLGVTNAGPGDATAVTVVDTLPAGTSYISGPSSCSAAGDTVTCVLGAVASGGSASAVIEVRVTTTGSITNSATVTTADRDTNAANDSATATSFIIRGTDLAVTQSAALGSGGAVVFTTTLSNNGPSVSHQAYAFTAAPSAATNVTIGSPDAEICGLETIGPNAGQYGCRFGTIAVGASVTMVFRFQPPTGATSATATATAYAGSGEFDLDGTNDTASATIAIPNTPAGTGVATAPVDTTTGTQPVSVTFSSVTAAGTTTLTASASGPTPPAGFTGFLLGTTYYDLHTTATFSGTVRVCISDPSVTSATRLFHYETNPTPPPSQIWVDRTVLPVTPPAVCADVTSFSLFAAFEPLADTTAPTITITRPAATTYVLGETVLASYSCADTGPVVLCQGSVANGAAIDTASLGTKTFTVNARDGAGNVAEQTVTYAVTYRICRAERGHEGNGDAQSVSIVLRLCDASGADRSSAAIAVTGLGVDGGALTLPGRRPAPGAFRYDARIGAYVLHLSSAHLAPGTHVLQFSVAGDAVHEIGFDVRRR